MGWSDPRECWWLGCGDPVCNTVCGGVSLPDYYEHERSMMEPCEACGNMRDTPGHELGCSVGRKEYGHED